MIFRISKDKNELNLGFAPESVTRNLKNFAKKVTISSQEFPLPAWQLVLFQKQEFLSDRPLRVPIIRNQ